MPDNISRSKGRPSSYKFDRGGAPAENGPYIGEVRNNFDPTRSGRLQVYIEEFAGDNKDDADLWRTVSYCPPFYGHTEQTGTSQGTGDFVGNQHTYGMWFTPPDIGTKVLCFFAAGDPNQGYYTGCLIEPGINHMVPAIGASNKFLEGNDVQKELFNGAEILPVTELNNEDPAISEDPRFFDKPKPVHAVVGAVMFQQGIIKDTIRGPIKSSSQRESPSACYGISTPGRPVWNGGYKDADIRSKLEKGQVLPQDAQVIARRGGHTIVMDDGDLEGRDNLVRIRTSKGHQITMSDDGDCFYIIHANGQSWIELGSEGTLDVYTTNSVNLRTQGTINLHADQDINMYAGNEINLLSKKKTNIASKVETNVTAKDKLVMFSENALGMLSDGTVAIKASKSIGIDGGGSTNILGGRVNLNSGGSASVQRPQEIKQYQLPDVSFVSGQGWVNQTGKLETAVTRAPTHEPYQFHNKGVNVETSLGEPATTPASPPVATAVASTENIPVKNGIDASNYVTQNEATVDIGKLNQSEVTGLLAQSAKDVGQPATAISLDKGIGKYGLTPQQLESTGFLKPGTASTFLKQDPSKLQSILGSPTVWTGKQGVNSLQGLLSDTKLQDKAKTTLMNDSFSQLKSAGVLTGREPTKDIGSLVSSASKFGVPNVTAWTKGLSPGDLTTQINSAVRNSQFALDFVNNKLSGLTKGFSFSGGFADTVNRASVDRTVGSLIGNAKVELPYFGPPKRG